MVRSTTREHVNSTGTQPAVLFIYNNICVYITVYVCMHVCIYLQINQSSSLVATTRSSEQPVEKLLCGLWMDVHVAI